MPDGGPWSMVGEQPPKPGGTFFYHETTNGSLHIMLLWIVCAFHGVSPRGRWSCVLPRWQINLNVLLWKNGTATLGNDISRIRTAKFLEVSQAKFAFRHRGHRTGAHTQMQIQHRSRAPGPCPGPPYNSRTVLDRTGRRYSRNDTRVVVCGITS